MTLAEAHPTQGDSAGAHGAMGESSVALSAPKTGQEVRENIAEKVGEIGEHFRSQVPQPATSATGPNA